MVVASTVTDTVDNCTFIIIINTNADSNTCAYTVIVIVIVIGIVIVITILVLFPVMNNSSIYASVLVHRLIIIAAAVYFELLVVVFRVLVCDVTGAVGSLLVCIILISV